MFVRILFLVLAAVSLPVNSAEFTLNGSVVSSSIKLNEIKCHGYSLMVKEDRFPEEAKGKVPAEVALKGFIGTDLILGSRAFVKKASAEYEVPVSVEKYIKTGSAPDDGRVYLPVSGYCLSESAFNLLVSSGENCKRCDLLIKYQINPDGSVTEIGIPSQEEFIGLWVGSKS